MPIPWLDSSEVVLFLGGSGAVLGMLGLAATVIRSDKLVAILPALGAALLAGFGLFALIAKQPAALGFGSLAVAGTFTPLFLLFRFPAAFETLLTWSRQRWFQSTCWYAVIVACPLIACYYAASTADTAPYFEPTCEPQPGWTDVDYPAYTDRGRPIRLRLLNTRVASDKDQGKSLTTLTHSVIRLSNDVNEPANCHGQVFANGRYWIKCEDVPLILEDNGYTLVSQPQAGDLAVYQDRDGTHVHTGIVRLVGEAGQIVVESKFGTMNRYLHLAHQHMYECGPCTYHRSQRAGHLVLGLDSPNPTTPAESASEAAN